MLQPMIDRAEEALRQSGLLGSARVVATERLTGGKASAVYKVLLSTGRAMVLKSAAARVVETEALWLRGWRDVGIDTPEVYGNGVLADATPFLLMECVAGPSVQSEVDAGRLPYDTTLRRIGRMLATMHSIRGSGFGSSHEGHLDASGNGQFQTLREKLSAEALPRGLAFALEVGEISERDPAWVERAVGTLSEHALVTGPRRTHGDFRTGNMLRDGDRLVVIDPTPALTHPYLCVAYSLLLPEIEDGIVPLAFFAGYDEVAPVDARALDAALLIRAGIMFNSFGRRRDSVHARRLPMVFARLRERFCNERGLPRR
jgi:aminoglycoside phosphotransferase (APT) family kinase protein